MSRHVAILPNDMLHALMTQLEGKSTTDVSQTSGMRILRLPHPRTGVASLFLPCQSSSVRRSSLLELQAISPDNQRSWFMPEGEILSNGQLLIMTPIDPVFMLIPILKHTCSGNGLPGTFRLAVDLFEESIPKLAESFDSKDDAFGLLSDFNHILSFDCVIAAMKRVCEVKEITPDITVYRYSPQKTMQYLRAKVARLARQEVCEVSKTIVRNIAKDGLMEDGKEDVASSARIRAACDLVSQYISPEVYSELLATFDFTALNAHLQAMQDEIAEAAVAEDISGGKAKKIKKNNAGAPGAKRKAQTNTSASHGVEKLKKANVKGMAKISSFFHKPTK